MCDSGHRARARGTGGGGHRRGLPDVGGVPPAAPYRALDVQPGCTPTTARPGDDNMETAMTPTIGRVHTLAALEAATALSAALVARGTAGRATAPLLAPRHMFRWDMHMRKGSLNPYCWSPLRGKPFSAVFVHEPLESQFNRWRLRGSGVNRTPETVLSTREVLRVCWELGLEIREQNWGSPANADSYHRDCRLLDGEVRCETGNYMCYPKGAWVTGAKAVYFLAGSLSVKVRNSWKRKFGLDRVSMVDLLEELRDGVK